MKLPSGSIAASISLRYLRLSVTLKLRQKSPNVCVIPQRCSRLAEHGVKGMVNASTQAVYGTSPPPWTETDPPAPVNAYSASKFAQEVTVENLASIAPSPANRFATHRLLVGPAPTMRVAPDEPVHVLARNALAGKDLVLPFEGQQMLDLLDVRDAAAAITHLIGSPVDHWPRVMNLTAGRQVTLLEVAELVCEQLRSHPANPGGQHRIVLQRGKTGSPRNFGMSNALIERTLGWSPRFTLPDTVRDVISALASARS
ncbi:MAG: SDR family oxidoreductase [Novosphingobium sp.]